MTNHIKKYRLIKGFTQTELAEHLKVSRQTVHSIETMRYIPSTILALKLAQLFACQVEDLFVLDESD
jgi:putative transcriptional regulator